ncbi:MAG: carbohydrate-binding family 9-like protein [Armatimonadetes bacterium]|nr:carbohydrate-binding family 9-like protein [Armatimonadota bacterium]
MRRFALLCFAAVLTFPALCQDGPVTIGGVTFDRIDPGEPFTQARLTVQDWTPPEPVAAESAAGMIPFVTGEPGDNRPDRAPKPEERVDRLSAFVTPDEFEPVWVSVWALEDLSSLTCTVDAGQAPITAEVRHAHFWPQRTGWRSRQWYITPELLLPCADGKRTVPDREGLLKEEDFDVPASSCAVLWFDLHAAADATPGTHRLNVRIQAEGKPALELPLDVEVLPFALRKPDDKFWLLYADAGRWRNMSDEQVLDELKDFARHGVTGLVEMPLGSVDLSEIKDGKVKFDPSAYNKLAAQCIEAGLPGPHVCSYGGMAPRIRDILGVQTDLNTDVWPEEIKRGVEAVSRAACEATKDAPATWYFYGVDEPGGDNTYAIQEYQAWHAGGANTYATFYRLDFLEKASEYLDAPCFVTGLVAAEGTARRAREACEQTGAEFWWYGTGCYVNPFPQEGYLFHNRYGAGFFFWKTGAKASVAWTFCRPHGDVFNDFDGSIQNSAEPKEQATTYPHLLRPNDWSTYQGAIPTLAWDGMREGVDDYRYLFTLERTIARALESRDPKVRELAGEARESMNALVDAIPWANPMGGVAFETRKMHQVRRAIADLIVGLENALAGKQANLGGREAAATLKVAVIRPGSGQPDAPPVVLPGRCPTAPVIDGVLDDEAWEHSAMADGFRDAATGRKTRLDTAAWITYDDEALYVAFKCPEPAMNSIVAEQTGHDTPMVWVDDGIEFFIAAPGRTPYAHLILNTNNSLYDELSQDPTWNPNAQSAVVKRDDGWFAELSIPWRDLEAGGISRQSVMFVNFCRNRFVPGASAHHIAWSPTYGGFHVPERFGTALLQEPPLALTQLDLPSLCGEGIARLNVRNLTDRPMVAFVEIAGRRKGNLALDPGECVRLALLAPNLRTEGTHSIPISWGVGDRVTGKALVPATTPPPLHVQPVSGLVSGGDVVEMPVSVNMGPLERSRCTVVVEVSDAKGTRTHSIAARPGSELDIPLQLSDRARTTPRLVDGRGRVIAQGKSQVFLAVPR